MRILSWDAMAGSKANPSRCRGEQGQFLQRPPPQQTDEKAVSVGAPRRHQWPLIGNKHRTREKIGALAQDLRDVRWLFYGKIGMASQKRTDLIVVFLGQYRTGDISDPPVGLGQHRGTLKYGLLLF